MDLDWVKNPDSHRPGAEFYTAECADSYVVVQEESVGHWGWCLCDYEGQPREFSQSVFSTADEAKKDFESYTDGH